MNLNKDNFVWLNILLATSLLLASSTTAFAQGVTNRKTKTDPYFKYSAPKKGETRSFSNPVEINDFLDLVANETAKFRKTLNGRINSKDGLLEHIRKNKIKSIAEFSQKSPEDFKEHVLIGFKSGSLHESDCDRPRVVVFTEGAKLSCSWNGGPDQQGFHKMECQDFDFKENTFHYFSIIFEKDRKEKIAYLTKEYAHEPLKLKSELTALYGTEAILIDDTGIVANDPSMGTKTPELCQTCHQPLNPKTDRFSIGNKDNVPIWVEEHIFWKGFLGEYYDQVSNNVDLEHRKKDGQSPSFTDACVEQFRTSWKSNLRYQNILSLDSILNKKNSQETLFTHNFIYTQWIKALNERRRIEQLEIGDNFENTLAYFECKRPLQDSKKIIPSPKSKASSAPKIGFGDLSDKILAFALNPKLRNAILNIELGSDPMTYSDSGSEFYKHATVAGKISVDCAKLEDLLILNKLKTNPLGVPLKTPGIN